MKIKAPLLENPTALAILNELDLYARDRQFIPVEHALFMHMTRTIKNSDGGHVKRYDITHSSYHYWFSRLVEEGYIAVDTESKAIRLNRHMIVERDTE